jgi:hypothetical protein
MRNFYYRPGRNAATALGSGALAVFAAMQWRSDGDVWWLLTLLVSGAAALKGAVYALNSEPALRFDNERLWVRTTFGSHAFAWNQVYGIALQIITVRRLGIIPIGRREILCIACEGGSFGARRLRVPAAAIELPAGGAPALVEILREAQRAAVSVSGAAMAEPGQESMSAADRDRPQTDFDADAAIARYLASKEAAQDAPVPVRTPSLASAPLRPVFGRRQTS